MSQEYIIPLAFFITVVVIIIIKANIDYYKKENREMRKLIENMEHNPILHRKCDECSGTGLDIWGKCTKCHGKGFVERTDN